MMVPDMILKNKSMVCVLFFSRFGEKFISYSDSG